MTGAPLPVRAIEDPYSLEADPSRPAAALARVAPDVRRAMQDWVDQRQAIVAFLAAHLVEARYNDRGYPLDGDYWLFPRSKTYRLTKQGAQKAGNIASLYVANPRTRVVVNQPDLLIVEYDVEIVSSSGHQRGFGNGSASSAEKGFQEQASKFGVTLKDGAYVRGDWRGGWNVIAGKAKTRATINGMENALAIGEVFTAILARKNRPQLAGGAKSAAPAAAPQPSQDHETVPVLLIPTGPFNGRPITDPEIPPTYLADVERWYRGRGDQASADQIVDELERRREASAG